MCSSVRMINTGGHHCGATYLNRQEASQKLCQLVPGSDEHSKLQDALIKTQGIVEINLPHTSYKVNTTFQEQVLKGGFGSSEHVEIGANVKLQGLEKENPSLLPDRKKPVLFSHIVALAGDFYGVVNKAISLPGGTPDEKIERFKEAFKTLEKADPEQVQRIINEIDQEHRTVKHSGLPHHCYSTQLMEKNNAIKKIKGDIDDLLVDNSDHFSKCALEAYQIGHAWAIAVAKEAGQGPEKNIDGLRRAYAIDAFACHFLTDLFSAGHIRNQRGELETYLRSQGFEPTWAKRWAGLLTGAQHEHDGKMGLSVENKRGDKWRAYGDGTLFTPKSEENKKRVIEATQKSVEEVYKAYLSSSSSSTDIDVMDLLPKHSEYNHPPLYEVENSQLFLYQEGVKTLVADNFPAHFLALALSYLPDSYVNDFIDSTISSKLPSAPELPPKLKAAKIAFSKAVFPRVERMTGQFWIMVGIASYCQTKALTEELNSKIGEMSEALQKTFEKTVEILEIVKELKELTTDLSWKTKASDIYTEVDKILKAVHKYQTKGHTYKEDDLKSESKILRDASSGMDSVLLHGTSHRDNLLEVYTGLLRSRKIPPDEVRIATTYWLRQMFQYRLLAHTVSETMQAQLPAQLRESALTMQTNLVVFRKELIATVNQHKDLIDVELVYENAGYIAFQLEKRITKKLMITKLKSTLEKT